jgi:hypothetical protein
VSSSAVPLHFLAIKKTLAGEDQDDLFRFIEEWLSGGRRSFPTRSIQRILARLRR